MTVMQKGFTASRGGFKPTALKSVLVANRGEIALRLLRCAKAAGLKTISVYTTEDEGAPHMTNADVAVLLKGKESEGKGYLDQDAIIAAAKQHGAQLILPGYGFLSENAGFAAKVDGAGIIFGGPRSQTIEELGLKHRSRQLADQAKVPSVPGSALLKDASHATSEANRIGYPVMLKASAGGGGMGLQVCRSDDELVKAYEVVVSRSKSLFGDADVFLEKFVEKARHIEVQIFGNGLGDAIHIGERECSIQRRFQKVFEEAPSPFADRTPGLRKRLTDCAISFAQHTKYRSAGTLEFLVDDETADFYLCEANTRLQVEHCVSEEVWDVDIVALMLQQADYELQGKGGIPADELKSFQGEQPKGWAIEARVYCENALKDFSPSPGLLQAVEWAAGSNDRIEGWVSTGTRITPSYDPLLAKVISKGSCRDEAVKNLSRLLHESKVYGPTNLDFLAAVAGSEPFRTGETLTSFFKTSGFKYQPAALEVLDSGMSCSVQDWPARQEIGHGLPVSGPVDALSFRLANVLVGNDEGLEGLEITLKGPTLKFHCAAVVALTGAQMELKLDGKDVPMYSSISVPAGGVLEVGALVGAGCRSYLAVAGGFPTMPAYLGSKATTAMLGLGGHQGRDLSVGDVLYLDASSKAKAGYSLPEDLWPCKGLSKSYKLYCMRGPFDDDGFLTNSDRDILYGEPMKVTHNVARSGIRLDCEDLTWSRKDGGEGGAHPSNVLEFSYSLGGLNFNGNTPVILGQDGPDLGGLLIALTQVGAEFRVGQLSSGDDLQWVPVTFDQARRLSQNQDAFLSSVAKAVSGGSASITPLQVDLDDVQPYQQVASPIVAFVEATDSKPAVVVRAAGDRNLLLEFGEMKLSIVNRCRVELLLREIVAAKQPGILYADPNVRSLTLRFDPAVASQAELCDFLLKLEAGIPDAAQTKIPSRQWRLPVCFGHPDVADVIDRYKQTTRDRAVYLDPQPGTDNTPYLAKANGLSGPEDVEKAVLSTSMLVVANGFFLGTPILLPNDPRYRLRSIKFNPTRLQTPEGALGYGGSCAAIYGVPSSGGYQIFARTLPGWSTWGSAPGFTPERPWLFGIFDTLAFYKVGVQEYDSMLASLKAGAWSWEVKETTFDVAEQVAFEKSVEEETRAFEARQAEALKLCQDEEDRLYREWTEEKERKMNEKLKGAKGGDWDWENDPKAIRIKAPMSASVWKTADVGQKLESGGSVVVLEAMKTEIPVPAPVAMVVKEIIAKPGSLAAPGDVLAVGLPA